MRRRPQSPIALGLGLLVLAAGRIGVASASQEPVRRIAPSTATMTFPGSLGALERPPVEFDHAAHTSALAREGCKTCHQIDEVGLHPGFSAAKDIADRDTLIDAYHDACIGCHKKRVQDGVKGGPLVCGGCHVLRDPGVPERAGMRWDYSLHERHGQAFPKKCETCHHSRDEATKTLVYVKGTEESCRVCHGDRDQGKNLSLANASHTRCVGCHLQRTAAGQPTGPILCVGCHDKQLVSGYKKLDPLPRLLRGQPDRSWIGAEGTRSGMVLFDHLGHEPQTGFCSGCHHQSLRPCRDCHTVTGAPEGQRITLEESYHTASSEVSCIGCHAARARAMECVGCHRGNMRAPSETSCVLCHSGPAKTAAGPECPLPPITKRPELAPLPATSDAYPETVVISVLAKRFEPVKLPHSKIVARLDAGARASSLANRFHGTSDRLCAGCHHHSPVGTPQPQCRSCHGETAAATSDRPALLAAYHRQCIGCHQAMGIKKVGCTDCHAAREVQP